MFNPSDLVRMIRDEVQRAANVIVAGAAGTNDKVIFEDIKKMYPGMPTLPQASVAHPFGFVSRASADCIQVVARHGADPSNRIIIGHRDTNRPVEDLAEGESKMYSAGGWSVQCYNDRVEITNKDKSQTITLSGDGQTITGSGYSLLLTTSGIQVKGSATQFLLQGDLTNTLLGQVIDQLANHTHAGNGAPPTQTAAIELLKTENIDSNKLLTSAEGGF